MQVRRFFPPLLIAGVLACASEARRDATALPDGQGQLCVEGPTAGEVEAVDFGSSLAAWFDEARGGVVTPYFMGLTCDETSLRLVGLGTLADATRWDARAVRGE